MNRALLSLWIGAMALSGCQSVSVWTSDELRQTFIGNTLAAAVSGGEVALYLEPDGAYVTTFSSGVETGTWTISDTALCLRGAPGDRSTGCWRASGTPDQVRFESDAITFYGRIIDGRRGDLPEAITAARLAETARQREAGMAEAALDDRPAPLPGSTRRPGDGRTPPDDAVNRHLDRWGTGAAPAMITAGPKTPLRDYPPYEHKTGSGVIRGAVGDSVLAPLDMALIGFSNRSAARRGWQTPYDDLELCFESRDRSWPGLILCVYHLADSPLLTGFPEANGCSVAESWSGDGPAQGRLFFAFSERRVSPGEVGYLRGEACGATLGQPVGRGAEIGTLGSVGDGGLVDFRVKVRLPTVNPLWRDNPQKAKLSDSWHNRGDPYLHWVQAPRFFFWSCFKKGAAVPPGVLSYPFRC